MKTNVIDFSIIVPAYNSSNYIEKCIKSVYSQTYKNYELIIVDDGSVDNTLEICKLYAQSHQNTIVLHKENGGHTSARNEGLKQAQGTYIIFLDSDDWLNEQTLEECMDEYELNNPDIIIFGLKTSNSSKRLSINVDDDIYSGEKLKYIIDHNLICDKNGKAAFAKSLSGKCFKKSIIYDCQMSIPKEILVGEDGLSFISTCLKSNSLSVIANKNACYNIFIRENSVSRTNDIDALKKVCILLDFYNIHILQYNQNLRKQINRNVVMQLYTAILYLLRRGLKYDYINDELDKAQSNSLIYDEFKSARFSLKGYKYIIKKMIIKHRMWKVAKALDKRRRTNERN